MTDKDMCTLRKLAGRYSELAQLDVQKERIDRYYRGNGLEIVRPVVLLNEIPWGEIKDDALVNTCSKEVAWLETELRRTLYQWDHFQADMVIFPSFRIQKKLRTGDIGITVQDTQIKGDTGTHIASHSYVDQLQTEADLAKLHVPDISYDKAGSERALQQAQEVFSGLMPVEFSGRVISYGLWDEIAFYRGVENLLMDLAMRPEFMHETVRKFAEIAEGIFKRLDELDILDPDPRLLHCTPACSRELPASDFSGKVRRKDVWGRCVAQIFGSVSPDMHDEFDLAYNEKLFGDCGLLYYGCCEPLDRKVGILRKRFKNLRKISITPWADPAIAAENIGGDFVMAAKPNPAFVSSATFNPEPVAAEITRYLEACKSHKTPCEFVLKDISTIACKTENLTQWVATVSGVIDRYY